MRLKSKYLINMVTMSFSNVNRVIDFDKLSLTFKLLRNSITKRAIYSLIQNHVFFALIISSVSLSTGCQFQPNKKLIVHNIEGDPISKIFRIKVNNQDIPVTVVPNVDTSQCVKIAEDYKKLPEYCWVDSRYISLHYVHFSTNSNPNIEMDANEDIHEFTIYPKIHGISGEVKGSKLSFIAPTDKAWQFVVRINELPMFVIVMELEETDEINPDLPNVVSLQKFTEGKKNIEDYTNIFSRAINEINGTGNTLYIPKGNYLSDEIKIHNRKNFNIYIASGALIRIKTEPDGENVQRRGIWIDHSENITISGLGCIDHQAYENFIKGSNDYDNGFQGYGFYSKFENIKDTEPFMFAPLLVTYSKNIELKDFTIRNGRIFNVNIRHSDDIVLKNIKVLTPAGSSPEWNDGLVIGSTRNLLIDGCFVYANDDPISSGHNLLPYDNRSSENFQIKNSFFWNPRANGFRLGWALNSYFGEIEFYNCIFSGNNNSAFIIHQHQKVNNLCYPKIRFEDCSFEDVDLYKRPFMWVDGACIKSLELVNVSFDAEPKVNAVIHGSENKGIEKILFENVMIGGKKLTKDNCDFDIKNTREVIFH